MNLFESIDREKTKQKLESTELLIRNDSTYIEKLADIIIARCIPELEQNFNEWIENKPFSDIVIGNGWTVNEILKLYPWVTFPDILQALKTYKKSNFTNESFVDLFYLY